MSRLTAKRERFCREMMKPKATQSDAYRAAFDTRGMKAATVHSEASRLIRDPQIIARIAEIQEPALAKVRVTRAQWLEKMQAFFYADVRKMFDEFGNPIELPELGEHEAMMIEGFEFNEEYTTVKKSDGTQQAVPTGSTKKYKLTSKLKAMIELGNVMGWYEDPDNNQKGPQRIFIRTWGTPEAQPVPLHTGGHGYGNGAGNGAAADGVRGGEVHGHAGPSAGVETHASGGGRLSGPLEGASSGDGQHHGPPAIADPASQHERVSGSVEWRQVLSTVHGAKRTEPDEL